MKNASLKSNRPGNGLYSRQNCAIHKARGQLVMTLDDCRELARNISGKASLSSLSIRERWQLIEELKLKGARVTNPRISETPVSSQGGHRPSPSSAVEGPPAPGDGVHPGGKQESPEEVYFARLNYWRKRFPKSRPGYASNKQLAWIQSLWELNFEDGRAGVSGLRGFIARQTASLEDGPVSDLAFLRDSHVEAVLTPLKQKGKANMGGVNET
ncbi:MAG: DUF1018 domain-containing protein [Deltaproteobacteria bacterium]|nr:DUF1018 domain-containing protein [Deltaproteobacteria bacterium]